MIISFILSKSDCTAVGLAEELEVFINDILQNKNSIISLTEKENELLALLFLEQKIDKDTILKKIWNYNSDIDTQTLESHIYRINKKLDLDLIKIGNEQCFLHNFAIN